MLWIPGIFSNIVELLNFLHAKLIELDETQLLNNLFILFRNAGALGSRLTGAGWGGCTVSLVPTEKVDEFLLKVKEQYYDPHASRRDQVNEALFATVPGSGAAVLKNIQF